MDWNKKSQGGQVFDDQNLANSNFIDQNSNWKFSKKRK